MTVLVIVVEGPAQWAWSDPKKPHVFTAGRHEITDPPQGLLRAVAAAEAAGVGVRVEKPTAEQKRAMANVVEHPAASRKQQLKAEKIRAELLPARDEQLLAAPAEHHPAILEEFEQAVDRETRARLGESR